MIVHWMRRDGRGRTMHAFRCVDSAIPLKALCGFAQWPQDLTPDRHEVRGPVSWAYCRLCWARVDRQRGVS